MSITANIDMNDKGFLLLMNPQKKFKDFITQPSASLRLRGSFSLVKDHSK